MTLTSHRASLSSFKKAFFLSIATETLRLAAATLENCFLKLCTFCVDEDFFFVHYLLYEVACIRVCVKASVGFEQLGEERIDSDTSPPSLKYLTIVPKVID